MKAFVCIVLFAVAALAAPDGKREKRGFLHSDHGWSSHDSYIELDHHPIIEHAPIIHKPVHKIVAVKKIVEVPKIIHVKKLVSVPKVVSIPKIITSHKIVEEPHYHYAPSHSISHGWW